MTRRWVPGKPCLFLVLGAAGCLLLIDLVKGTRCPVAAVSVLRQLGSTSTSAGPGSCHITSPPCCMEICVSSNRCSTSGVTGSTAGSSSGSSGSGNSRTKTVNSSSTTTSSSRSLQANRSRSSGKGSSRAAPGWDGVKESPDAQGSAVVSVAVGYQDGSSWLYQLTPELCGPGGEEQAGVALLQQLALAG